MDDLTKRNTDLFNMWYGNHIHEIANENYNETGKKMTAEDVSEFLFDMAEIEFGISCESCSGFFADIIIQAIHRVDCARIALNIEYDNERETPGQDTEEA